MSAAPSRHYVWADGRWVHYWRLGQGPIVVLLHGSPQSARAVLPMMRACAAAGMTAIAPDTPGNGLSDPLHDGAQTQTYAIALIQFMGALKIARAPIYGFHTGATIAATLATLHPERVAALVLDGLPAWTKNERADLLVHYLPAFAPTWDGAHLTWAWARMEEQTVFFPWYRNESAAFMPGYAVSAPEALHANVIDLLRAGDAYRTPYAAAFAFEAEPIVAALRSPTWITASPSDPLHAHLARLAAPNSVRVEALPDDRSAALAAMASYLRPHATQTLPASPDLASDGKRLRGYLTLKGGLVAVRNWTTNTASARMCEPFCDWRTDSTDTPTLDWPGHGDGADTWAAVPDHFDDMSALLRDAVGATIALQGVARAPFHGAPPPEMTPRWDGAHLTAAWRYLRRRAIFAQWDKPESAQYRTGAEAEGLRSVEAMQARLIGLLLSQPHHAAIWRALISPA